MSQAGGAGSPPGAGDGASGGGRRRRVRPNLGSDQTRTGRRRRSRPTTQDSGGRRRRASRGARSSETSRSEPTRDGAATGDTATADTETGAAATGHTATGDATHGEAGRGDAGDRAGQHQATTQQRPPTATAEAGAAGAVPARQEPSSWWSHPVLRAGAYAWALIGIGAVAWAVSVAAGKLGVVVVPVLLALFPAALLHPVARWLHRAGIPAALAALATMLGLLVLLAGVGTVLAPQVAEEIPKMAESAQEGIRQVERFLDESAPFGVDAAEVRTQIEEIAQGIDFQAVMDVVRAGALGAATAVAEIAVGLLLLVVVLFFYLKDGERLGRWLCQLFPASVQEDAEAVGQRVWHTIGSYFRGQLLVALLDAIGIGVGLLLLGVPLALPLSVLVFFGGLFPIVGAVVTGALAVLVALATSGPVVALAVLAVAVGVQQLESNVVAPYVLGKATALHPLAVLTVITAGGLLLGVLGAFLAVPVAASVVKGLSTLRARRRARGAHSIPAVTGG